MRLYVEVRTCTMQKELAKVFEGYEFRDGSNLDKGHTPELKDMPEPVDWKFQDYPEYHELRKVSWLVVKDYRDPDRVKSKAYPPTGANDATE